MPSTWLKETYLQTPVGATASLRSEDPGRQEDFQAVVAAAEDWEALQLIEITDIQEERGTRVVDGLTFRRLK